MTKFAEIMDSKPDTEPQGQVSSEDRTLLRVPASFDIMIHRGVMSGKPCIRNTRIPVALIVRLFRTGYSMDEVLRDYPHLKREQVEKALEFAEELLEQSFVMDPK